MVAGDGMLGIVGNGVHQVSIANLSPVRQMALKTEIKKTQHGLYSNINR
jgi:hypothetical protein